MFDDIGSLVRQVASTLTNMELYSICLAIYLNKDPRLVPGYEKAAVLFTEESDGHPSASREVEEELYQYIDELIQDSGAIH